MGPRPLNFGEQYFINEDLTKEGMSALSRFSCFPMSRWGTLCSILSSVSASLFSSPSPSAVAVAAAAEGVVTAQPLFINHEQLDFWLRLRIQLQFCFPKLLSVFDLICRRCQNILSGGRKNCWDDFWLCLILSKYIFRGSKELQRRPFLINHEQLDFWCQNICSGGRKNCKDDAQTTTFQKVNYHRFLSSENVETWIFVCSLCPDNEFVVVCLKIFVLINRIS